MPDAKRSTVTIYDVAREAGVSYATVSRVLNDHQNVRPETRERVLAAIDHLGFVANPQARRLKGVPSDMVAVLADRLHDPFLMEVLVGIEADLTEAGYNVMLITTQRHQDRESHYVAMIAQGMAVGLIVILPRNVETYLGMIRQQRFPHVLLFCGSLDEGSSTVEARNYDGAYQSARYLYDLGHRRIGCISGPLVGNASIHRLAGFKSALTDCGLSPDSNLIIRGDFTQQRGYDAGTQMLKLPDPPTAISVHNDAMAIGVLDAAHSLGLRIPDDVSVIGFDDISSARITHPALTTVGYGLDKVGSTAVRILLEQIAEPDSQPQRIELDPYIIERETCGPPQVRLTSQ